MKYKKIVKIIILIFIIIVCLMYFSGLGKTALSIIKYYAPFNLGNRFKEKIYVFNNVRKLKLEKIQIEKLLREIPEKVGYIPLKAISDEGKNIILNNNNFKIKKFKIPLLLVSKNEEFMTKGNSYIDYHKKNLFVVSGNGIFSYINVKEFEKKNSRLLVIPTNIKEIIKYDDFFINSRFGIKDILINENNIYISYTNNLTKNCFNISVLYAKINTTRLKFKKFFTPEDYICKDYIDFNAHSSGGRIVEFQDNKLLLSTGEFLDSAKSQISNNTLGKILAIKKDDKSYELISKGHRNVQGLFYDKKNNIIYSTEHGPMGGDEININNLKNNDEVKNYGWPISSYGEHYGGKSLLNRLTRYIKYPLNKSHKEYGFTEPLKYFIPSIGISEIVLLDNNFLYSKNEQLLVASLAGMSLHYLQINDEKIKKHSVINLNERIRDMIYVKNLNMIFLSLEKSNEEPKIAILY